MIIINDDYHCTHNHITDMNKKSVYVNKESVHGNDDGNVNYHGDGNDNGNSNVSVNISKR